MASPYELRKERSKQRLEEARKRTASAAERRRYAKGVGEVPTELEDLATLPPRGLRSPSATVAAPEGWREKTSRIGGNVASFITGKDPHEAARDVGSLLSIADFAPVAGDIQSAADVGEDISKGDYTSAGINTLATALPFIPGKKGLKKAKEKIADAVPALKATKKAEAGLTKGTGGGLKKAREAKVIKPPEETSYTPPVPESVGGVKPEAIKQEAIGAVNLRRLPKEEAMKVAESERHIIPKSEKQGGGFVGAPHTMRSREDLERLRANFDKDVGLGVEGADWYERAQAWIKRVAGDDPKNQRDLAQSLALFSAQANPDTNLGFHLQAAVSNMMGEPQDIVRTGLQSKKYRESVESGRPIFEPTSDESKKTAIYGQHLDPTSVDPVTGTNDIWHGRAWGYTDPETGEPWDAAFSPQQHSWLDAETLLAEKRANEAKTGGRTDWTAGRVQASPWVANKARGLQAQYPKKYPTYEAALEDAKKSYPEFEEKYTAYGTHEKTPGKETGILPSVAHGDEATRTAFSRGAPWWSDPDTGRDILASAFPRANVAPSQETSGLFEGTYNPGQTSRVLMPMSGEAGARVLHPSGHKFMKGNEAFRAYVDAQDMGAYSMPIFGNKVGMQNAYEVRLPGDELWNPERMNAAKDLREGLPEIIDYGGGRGMLASFGERDPSLFGAEGERQLQQSMTQRFGEGATARPATLESGNVPYSMEGAWQQGEGSGAVTQMLLDNLTPQHIAAFNDPKVRERVAQQLKYMIEVSGQTGDKLRGDYVNALKIISSPAGFDQIIAGIKKGVLPVGAVAVMLPYFTQREAGVGAEEPRA